MRATISRSSPPAASSTTGATVDTSSGDSQLMIAPSASRPARRSMPSRSAATRIGGVCSGPHAELEAVDLERVVGVLDLLAAERVLEEPHHVADLLVGLLERDAVPPLDDHVARRADADREPAGRGVGHRRHALCHAGRRPGVGGHDRRAEPEPRFPRRGQCERGERVGAVGLGRPDVGVAHVGERAELLAVAVQRAGERNGHARSNRERHGADTTQNHRCGPEPVTPLAALCVARRN